MLGVRYCLQVLQVVTSTTHYGGNNKWDEGIRRANCNRPNQHHTPPDEKCGCGYYAFYNIDTMDGVADSISHFAIVIVVEAFGKVVLHERGFRAEYMQPKYVIWPIELSEQTLHYGNIQASIVLPNHMVMNAYWSHGRYFTTDMNMSNKASRILNVPIIESHSAQRLLLLQ